METTNAGPAPGKESSDNAGGKTSPQRILIGFAGSMMFFVKVYIKEQTYENGEKTLITKPKHIPIRLRGGELAIPAIAGGCSCVIDESLAKSHEITYNQLLKLIKGHSGYGFRFVFLDDVKHNDRILTRLKKQAELEESVHVEALEAAVGMSDLATFMPHPLDVAEQQAQE